MGKIQTAFAGWRGVRAQVLGWRAIDAVTGFELIYLLQVQILFIYILECNRSNLNMFQETFTKPSGVLAERMLNHDKIHMYEKWLVITEVRYFQAWLSTHELLM